MTTLPLYLSLPNLGWLVQILIICLHPNPDEILSQSTEEWSTHCSPCPHCIIPWCRRRVVKQLIPIISDHIPILRMVVDPAFKFLKFQPLQVLWIRLKVFSLNVVVLILVLVALFTLLTLFATLLTLLTLLCYQKTTYISSRIGEPKFAYRHTLFLNRVSSKCQSFI
jgi:hypothetical protein